MPEFVAVDGEADRDGRYIIMCDSLGRTLHNPAGIRTRQAIEFLTAIPHLAPKSKVVCFGLNYDANQWVEGLSARELQRLAYEGRTSHAMRFKLTWMPRKLFTITDIRTDTHVRVSEVFGFFQTTFVKALADWGLKATPEVETMKVRRGTFTQAQLQRVTDYCLSECRLLVELMNRLAEACADADCTPARDWIGAGAIASKLLTANHVKDHHAYDVDLADRDTIERFVLGSYFGGRVEMLRQGEAPALHTVDVRSAYPFAATRLRSLDGAKLIPKRRYDPRHESAVWEVSWQDQDHGGVCPFPVRLPDFTIVYPRCGRGRYHAAEIRAALDCGYQLTFHGGVTLRCRPAPRRPDPFHWIPALYEQRDRLKREGHAAEKALKLGLNSVYGKLAQGYGHAGNPPAFQSYMWAGEITARTRARMLRLLHRVKAPVMVATDGLFSLDRCKASDGSGLGGLEHDRLIDPLVVQAGVYGYACPECDGAGRRGGVIGAREGACQACGGTGYRAKSRGFAARDVDYHQLRDLWQQQGPEGCFPYHSRRFIGLRVALARGRPDIWRTWPDEPRTINLNAARKITPGWGGPYPPMIALEPLDGPYESMPYQPKQSLYDDPTDDVLEMMIADDQPNLDC